MKALFISVAATLGALVAGISTSGCLLAWIDEPTMPKSMIEK